MQNFPIHWQPEHLENDLVRLLPLKAKDFELLYEIASDPLLWEQHPEKDRYKREVFIKFFKHAIERGAAFLIEDKETQKIIGSSGYYDYKPENASIAVGYTFLARPFWGGVYNHALKELMLDYAFQHVNRVYFYIGAPNFRSQKAITKIGAKKVREFFVDESKSSTPTYEYVIDKFSWQNRIIKTDKLTELQRSQINALWNAEFPVKLKDRFPLFLADLKNASHYLISGSNQEVRAWSVSFEREGEIWFSIIVDQTDQGSGLGRLLIDRLKSENTGLCGWVIDHNYELKMDGEIYPSPLNFYAKQGFETAPDHRIDTEMISAVKIKWESPSPVFWSDDMLTKLAKEKGLGDWSGLMGYIKNLPYGRNTNRDDLALVLKEEKGTCSSKHALLKKIADLNGVAHVRLILAVYKMSAGNTPKIGNVLHEAGLPYMPEAHCYLEINGIKLDLTSSDADIERIRKDILTELEIVPEQVGDFKVTYHKDFLKRWISESGINRSFEDIWRLREQCIKNLESISVK